ncbi:deoxyribonuclease V [Thalassotalea sp. G20_0]|uniref:deoxyribonuclease V n=1 Tax=Thalassotalea sp. G20_0 TaxID=2821093 RepID=UPI001AD9734B|nr:deoxyribonuclease V [Thalassotalea sp. G20_0]
MSEFADLRWDLSYAEAISIQTTLASQVIQQDDLPEITRVAGVDVGFEDNGRVTRAAVAVLAFPALELLDYTIAKVPTRMPYIPGLLSFRECPAILDALGQLRITPDLLLCDGQGMAHPRRFGVACHVGVLTGLPAIGVAKSRLCGHSDTLPEGKGARVELRDNNEVIGSVLRTRSATRPLYISIGHRISLNTAVHYVESCLTRFRLPETTRWADALASNRGQAVARANQILAR